jgi:hypothetical protein
MDCKTAALALINALICAGPGRDSPTFRSHIRHEFLMLGIDPVLDTLRKVSQCRVVKMGEAFNVTVDSPSYS